MVQKLKAQMPAIRDPHHDCVMPTAQSTSKGEMIEVGLIKWALESENFLHLVAEKTAEGGIREVLSMKRIAHTIAGLKMEQPSGEKCMWPVVG